MFYINIIKRKHFGLSFPEPDTGDKTEVKTEPDAAKKSDDKRYVHHIYLPKYIVL